MAEHSDPTPCHCGRWRLAWTAAMHPICDACDRVACELCHKRLVGGTEAKCPNCNGTVALPQRLGK